MKKYRKCPALKKSIQDYFSKGDCFVFLAHYEKWKTTENGSRTEVEKCLNIFNRYPEEKIRKKFIR